MFLEFPWPPHHGCFVAEFYHRPPFLSVTVFISLAYEITSNLPKFHLLSIASIRACAGQWRDLATTTKGGKMIANPSVAHPNLIPDTQQTVSKTSEPKPTTLLERGEEALRKAFGDDEDTIANSLRGL